MAARFWAFAFTQLPRGTDNLGSNPETRHSSRQVASHGTWHFENSIQPKAESTRTPKLQCNPKAETGAACMDPPARDHHRPELAEPRVMEPYRASMDLHQPWAAGSRRTVVSSPINR